MRPSLLLPLLLLGSAASAAKPSAPVRFAWPDGLKAQVEVHLQGERESGGTITQRHDARARFTLTTTRHGEELHVKREPFQAWEGQLPVGMGSAAERLVDRIPLVRVSREGKFLGIEGADQARAAFTREVNRESLDESRRRLFDAMMTDDALRNLSADFWNTSIGGWAVTKLAPGKSKEMRTWTTVPQLGGGRLDMVSTLRHAGPAACTAGEKPQRCVELVIEVKPDQAQVVELMNNRPSSPTDSFVIEAFDMSQELRAVVEPNTLVPHHLTLRRSNQLRMREPDGKRQGAGEKTERTYVFRYASPATKPAP